MMMRSWQAASGASRHILGQQLARGGRSAAGAHASAAWRSYASAKKQHRMGTVTSEVAAAAAVPSGSSLTAGALVAVAIAAAAGHLWMSSEAQSDAGQRHASRHRLEARFVGQLLAVNRGRPSDMSLPQRPVSPCPVKDVLKIPLRRRLVTRFGTFERAGPATTYTRHVPANRLCDRSTCNAVLRAEAPLGATGAPGSE